VSRIPANRVRIEFGILVMFYRYRFDQLEKFANPMHSK
jgi:hypothetical protein